MKKQQKLAVMLGMCLLWAGYLLGQTYSYPIKPGSDSWNRFSSHQEMIEATQLPENYLINADTDDLLETCMEYPLLLDMLAYNNLDIGIKALKSQFNGIRELINRPNSGKSLINFYKTFVSDSLMLLKNNSVKGLYTIRMSIVETLLSQKEILNQLRQEDLEQLTEILIAKRTFKEQYKDLFGTLGITSLAYAISQTLNSANSEKWWDGLSKNDDLKLFVNSYILSTPETIEKIFLIANESLKK